MPQNTVSFRIGTNCSCLPVRILTKACFPTSTRLTAGSWARVQQRFAFLSELPARVPVVAQELFTLCESNCASGVEPHCVTALRMEDSEVACEFHARRQENGMVELPDSKPPWRPPELNHHKHLLELEVF